MPDSLPPEPRLPPIVQAFAYHRDPLGVLRRAQARLGSVFTLRFPLKEPLVFVAVPDAVEELLRSDPVRAHAGEARRAIIPQASPRSPFGGDGDAHEESRCRMSPAFAPQRVAAIEPAIRALAQEHSTRWPLARPFRLLEATRELCTDIAVRVMLGVGHSDRSRRLVAAIRKMLDTPGNPPLPLPGGREGPDGAIGRLGDRAFVRRSAEVRRLLEAELRERRGGADPGEDLLGAMVRSRPAGSDEALIDELLIVLMAAQEPPAIAIANILYELARRPDLCDRFVSEPAAREALVAEALRLRPSASAALRKLTEPMRIDGRTLAAGTTVACPSLLLHRNPDVFPDPDAFRASRFERTEHPPCYIPFGGGARSCLGQSLAEAQFRAVLPAVLGRLRL